MKVPVSAVPQDIWPYIGSADRRGWRLTHPPCATPFVVRITLSEGPGGVVEGGAEVADEAAVVGVAGAAGLGALV